MKRKTGFWKIGVLLIAIAVMFIGSCDPEKENDPPYEGDTDQTDEGIFISITDFNTWLSAKPNNTATIPYNIKLNVSDLGGDYKTAGSVGYILSNNNTKYVILDLSGSTFTSIEDMAFSDIINFGFEFEVCDTLTGIIIPNSVTSIGDGAFAFCINLTNVTIGNSVTSIGDFAFAYSMNLTSITIPNSVTSIGEQAFSYCESLTSVTIGNSVTSIDDWAFIHCTSLIAINVDTNNTTYSSVDSVLYDKNKTELITYPCGKTDAFTIPNSVTSIGDSAFAACSLISVNIPNSVTSIGDAAFFYCESLTNVTIGNSVTSIGSQTFEHCTNLTSVTIGNSVTSIGDHAFYDCTSLTSINIPNSVTSIGDWAFFDCSLISVTIGNSVTSIGNGAFYYNTNLTSLTSVTFLGTIPSDSYFSYNAFYGDLRTKFYTDDATNGTPGTYTRPIDSHEWTRQ